MDGVGNCGICRKLLRHLRAHLIAAFPYAGTNGDV
jgi:hypothetical protein